MLHILLASYLFLYHIIARVGSRDTSFDLTRRFVLHYFDKEFGSHQVEDCGNSGLSRSVSGALQINVGDIWWKIVALGERVIEKVLFSCVTRRSLLGGLR